MACCVLKMAHQSLCSATGMPHSMQIRILGLGGWVLRVNNFFKNDI
jgi:hypothetical protein